MNDFHTGPYGAVIGGAMPAGTTNTTGTWGNPDFSAVTDSTPTENEFPHVALGEAASIVEDVAEAKAVPTSIPAMALLAAACAMSPAGAKAQLSPSTIQALRLYLGTVAPPSAGKSRGADPFMRAAQMVEAKLSEGFAEQEIEYERACLTAAAVRAAWKKEVKAAFAEGRQPPIMPNEALTPPRQTRTSLLLNDASKAALIPYLPNNAPLVHLDELPALDQDLRTLYLRAFDGQRYTYDRNGLKVVIPEAALSLFFGTQPGKVCKFLAGADDGLASRILWSLTSRVPFRNSTKAIDEAALAEKLATLRALLVAQPVLTATDKAQEIYGEYMLENDGAAPEGRLGSIVGKLPGNAIRLAGFIECLQAAFAKTPRPIGQITEASMLAALLMVEGYFKPCAARVTSMVEDDRAVDPARLLAAWLATTGSTRLNARLLHRGSVVPGLRDVAAGQAVAKLVAAGLLRQFREPGKVGRPSADYEVHPALLSMEVGQ